MTTADRERLASDQKLPPLSARANAYASKLGGIAMPTLVRAGREAYAEEIAREIGWPVAEVWRFARTIRETIGPSAPKRDWLIAAGWLAEDRTTEQLPPVVSGPRVSALRVAMLLGRYAVGSSLGGR